MKIRAKIACPYCGSKARPDTFFRPVDPKTVRYGCEGGHYFAVPTKDVLVKEKPAE